MKAAPFLLQPDQNTPETLYEQAKTFIEEKAPDKADPLIEEILRQTPGNVPALELKAASCNLKGDFANALALYRLLKKNLPDNTALDISIGQVLSKKGNYKEAVISLEKGLETTPNAGGFAELSRAYLSLGNREKAKEAILKARELAPENAEHLYMYTCFLHRPENAGDPVFKTLERLVSKTQDDLELSYLHFALFKACKDTGEDDAAFDHLTQACRHKRKTFSFNSDNTHEYIKRLQLYFSKEFVQSSGIKGCPSDAPVFILGLPRSGTTLLEQILHAHPDIIGIGEDMFLFFLIENYSSLPPVNGEKYPLRASPTKQMLTPEAIAKQYEGYIRDKTGGAKRIVNKAIGNRFTAGFLKIAFPNAKFIHIHRHPMDCLFSCLSINFTDMTQPFTYDMEELAQHYRDHTALMRHWKDVLGESLLDVAYEDIVADTEKEARRIIAFLGMPWDDACLEFYKTKKAVATASVMQVRQPVYTGSVGRWKRFGKHLIPLIEALGEDAPEDAQAFLKDQKSA